MIATIKLFEPNHDYLKVKTKRKGLKAFVYIIEIGPFVIVKPSMSAADRYLSKLGYVLSDDCSHYVPKYRSDQQIDLERNYTKAI